jgi:hypothetical protein
VSVDPNAPGFGADPDAEVEHLDQTEKDDVESEGLTIAEAEEQAKQQQGDSSAPQGDV